MTIVEQEAYEEVRRIIRGISPHADLGDAKADIADRVRMRGQGFTASKDAFGNIVVWRKPGYVIDGVYFGVTLSYPADVLNYQIYGRPVAFGRFKERTSP